MSHSSKHFFFLTVLFFCLLSVSSLSLQAQNTIAIEATSILAFQDDELQIWDEKIKEYKSHGFQLMLIYHFDLKNEHWSINTGAGTKLINAKGELSSGSNFESQALKLVFLAGSEYQINESLSFGLNFTIENNKDFAVFGTYQGDLWRHNADLNLYYKLNSHWSVACKYARLLKPNKTVFLLMNPANQIGFGFKYQFK